VTADEFRKIREQLGLTQIGLAYILRVPIPGHIRKWEEGVSQIPGPVAYIMELLRDGVITPGGQNT
jgi:DNA-binding transcriptional regulator YiaG